MVRVVCAYLPLAAVHPNITFPIGSREYGGEGTAIIGGHMYRGCLFPNLKGIFINGDLIL